MMNIARSTFYYKPKQRLKQIQDADLRDRIEGIIYECPGYGSRRVTQQLKREGWPVNRKRIGRIMKENGLLRIIKKKKIFTTDSNHDFRCYPNLLKDCLITTLNQAWVADITYIRILTAFVYLAVILDAFSRKAIGYALSQSLDAANLTLAALKVAVGQRRPAVGCIHHSDRGVQYACEDYVYFLKEHKFEISMAAKGNPYDNAMAESFMKTLKYEEVYLWEYETLAEVYQRIPFFIEEVYNKKRLHSAIGYLPPVEFESTVVKDQKIGQLLTI